MNYDEQNTSSRQPSVHDWLYSCRECKTGRIMGIESVIPLLFTSSSAVTFRCDHCGAILMEIIEDIED